MKDTSRFLIFSHMGSYIKLINILLTSWKYITHGWIRLPPTHVWDFRLIQILYEPKRAILATVLLRFLTSLILHMLAIMASTPLLRSEMTPLLPTSRGQLRQTKYGTDLSPKFNNLKDLSLWIRGQPCMQMDFWHISRNNTYVSIPGQLSGNYFHAWMFSNSRGKVLITAEILYSPDLRVVHIYLSITNYK